VGNFAHSAVYWSEGSVKQESVLGLLVGQKLQLSHLVLGSSEGCIIGQVNLFDLIMWTEGVHHSDRIRMICQIEGCSDRKLSEESWS